MTEKLKFGGQCPRDYHGPLRCKATSRVTRERCRRHVCIGKDVCYYHGGRYAKDKSLPRINTLPRFYRNRLSQTLNSFVDACLDTSPQEQLALFEELAIARDMCGKALEDWDKIKNLSPEQRATLGEQKYSLLLETMEALARQAMTYVQETSKSATYVYTAAKDKLSIHNLQAVVNQITRLAYTALGPENEHLAKKFDELIQREVRVIETNDGTALTPDMDAMLMDSTVPRGPAPTSTLEEDDEHGEETGA